MNEIFAMVIYEINTFIFLILQMMMLFYRDVETLTEQSLSIIITFEYF